jgi:ketosteroid isomerase-like protein
MEDCMGSGAHRNDVKNAYAAWDRAFNTANAKAVADFYEANALFLPASHEVIRGPVNVEKFFSKLFSAGVTNHQLELIEASGAGDLVYAAATWSASGKDDQGQPSNFSGVATHVFQRQADGSFKLKLHTFN